LIRGLSLTEDRLRESAAELAMMIELGEAEVFVGQGAQILDGVIDGLLAACDTLEKCADGLFIKHSFAPTIRAQTEWF
jgi:hypothetical protein